MREREWNISPVKADWIDSVCLETGICPILATVLYQRNIRTPKDIYQFLSPRLDQIRSPFVLKDMDKAVNAITEAILAHKKILIFGDYDVDGITATAVMSQFFTKIGADITTYVPSRLKEGYGLRPEHIERAASDGICLIITVDCGSSSEDAILCANKHGIGVIITDHHEIEAPLKGAVAIVNPKQAECESDLSFLSGVGVAYYVILALRKKLREKEYFIQIPEPNLKDFCDLVALGTVADVVPMIEENRIFTRVGLNLLKQNPRPGILALMREARIHPFQICERDIAFSLAPRLNAAGRVTHAQESISLLIEEDPQNAEYLSEHLDRLNEERRKIERVILAEVQQQISETPELLDRHALVLYGQNWHQGVLGIVASRVSDQYRKPSLIFSIKDGLAKGSCRSGSGIDLYQALTNCSDLFIQFGGHANAAGVLLSEENIPAFIIRLEDTLAIQKEKLPEIAPVIIDCEIQLADITPQLLENLEQLQPFGPKNDEPLFMARDISVVTNEIVGNRHLRIVIKEKNQKTTYTAIRFNYTELVEEKMFSKIAFHLRWNYWNGRKSPQLVLVDF